MTDAFWAVIERQLQQLRSATTVADVIRILTDPPAPDAQGHGPLVDGHAFFAGSGGDGTVTDALAAAGWELLWMQSDYYWVMGRPDGQEVLTYIEGDIYRGNRR